MSNVKGLSNILSNLKKEGKNINECITIGMQNALLLGQKNAKMNAPVGDNGYLRENIHMHIKKENSKIEGCVYGTVEYHAYVECGTGPTGNGTYPYNIKGYTIHYKANKWKGKIPFLENPETGDLGIRYIAGQEAQPHMYPAFLDVEKALVKEIKKASKR